MLPSISLAVYLLIGLFYANYEYNQIIEDFEEEIDEKDPDEQEFINNRDNLYEQLHKLHMMVGDRGLKAIIFLFFMIFWLPMIIYTKIMLLKK